MIGKKKIQVLAFICVMATNLFGQEIDLGKLIVHAGSFVRDNTVVNVSLEGLDLDLTNKDLKVYEVKGKNKIPVNIYIEQGYHPRLWWVLSGTTKKGSKRTFQMMLSEKDTSKVSHRKPIVQVNKDIEDLIITINDKKILRYRITPLPAPEGASLLYERSAFIHPLWSPKGEVLTRVQPPDHYHHVGIWNPWTHTEFENRKIDFWNLNKGQGTVRTKKVTLVESSDVMGRFKAIHEHIDLTAPDPTGSKVALNEEWEVRVWNVDPNSAFWLVDFVSSMNCDSESPLIIQKYRYQGFGFRATEKWNDKTATILTSEGKNKTDGNGTRARWCNVNGVSDFGTSGILFMTNPSNYNYPEPLRIWPVGANNGKENVFINFNPTQDRNWKLNPGNQYVLKYRMLVYDGEITKERAEQAWNDYANPPKVELVLK
ncbi:PmoA family protein [Fulvivirgaceae bacterium BMA10]|uniref:PmoA family protein n=1 Tax=Splendidivirga corallicola TaxID=3051826 RepID=A0ABT8KXF9_9BACT|nr:PmoA family protein [Fulvivirgaceae bacterium BMA10]